MEYDITEYQNLDMITVLNILEQIILDEYASVRYNSKNSPISEIYAEFLLTANSGQIWFGLRDILELTRIWDYLREEVIIRDDKNNIIFRDAAAPTRLCALTQITQRLKLIISKNTLDTAIDSIADVLNIYNSETLVDTTQPKLEDGGSMFLYDTGVSTTLPREDLVKYLENNEWLVVYILLSFISKEIVIDALKGIDK